MNYKLDYKEYITIKQATYNIMKNYNNKIYNSNKQHKQYITYDKALNIILKKPKAELLDIIAEYHSVQEQTQHRKLLEHNQTQIINKNLINLTDQQIEHLSIQLQQLEEIYYLQLDTDYSDKQSILKSYQQVLAYKYYNISQPYRDWETDRKSTRLNSSHRL